MHFKKREYYIINIIHTLPILKIRYPPLDICLQVAGGRCRDDGLEDNRLLTNHYKHIL